MSEHEKPCPVCGKPRQAQTRPFCSSRCADIDLGRWFNGAYRVASPPEAAAEDEG